MERDTPSRRSGHPSPCALMRPSYTSCTEHYDFLEQQARREQESRFLTLTSIPRMANSPPPSPRPLRARSDITHSPFLRLPTEIRLQIYSLLVLPRKPTDLIPSEEKKLSSSQDYFDYDKKQYGTDRLIIADLTRPTLLIRTVNGTGYGQRYGEGKPRGPHVRSTYTIRADRFRNRCMKTTYHCINNPRLEDHLGILGTNKQTHAEAAELMYSSYTFDFDTHIEAIVPFLNDLTPFARSCIKSMRFVKRALAYDKEFDRAEWSSAMRYLTSSSSNVNLRRLELGIVAGRPGPHGWDRIARYTAPDFKIIKDGDGMQWMQYLLEIRDLDKLDVCAVVEHCPPGTNSMAMAGFIRFSASIETGFAQFLREQLLHC